MKREFSIRILLLWLLLNASIIVAMELALFVQTTSKMEHDSLIKKILTAEFWATIQWIFVIPAQRIGNLFLSAPQLALSSYVFNYIGQVLANVLWLKVPTTIDDYTAMAMILVAMVISKYHLIG
jgi:uncharacterized protein (DUF486 family)